MSVIVLGILGSELFFQSKFPWGAISMDRPRPQVHSGMKVTGHVSSLFHFSCLFQVSMYVDMGIINVVGSGFTIVLFLLSFEIVCVVFRTVWVKIWVQSCENYREVAAILCQ